MTTCDDNDDIFRGDDTDAFGQNWLTINATIPDGWTIAKADIKIGVLPVKSYDDPVFPLSINLTDEETAQLQTTNSIYMAVYDSQGRKQTCHRTITFKTNREVV